MFMEKYSGVWVLVLLLLALPAGAWAQGSQWQMVHGEVLQVLPEEHKLVIACGGEEVLLAVEEDCRVFRQDQPVALASLRPVAAGAYQDVLCWINTKGLVSLILVNYYVQEEDGLLVAYDIFGNRK
ncbi:MAG: hypothetical protein WBI99_01400 [Limnochordia bacterium]|nr:hypothetical protein [Limnochordia bacterium]HPZ80854.1 hypothetical protein [Limnochordia bacterium]HQE37359.1 hypothetical protein [Limnochordia bacterium]